jgi:hypothetical protein
MILSFVWALCEQGNEHLCFIIKRNFLAVFVTANFYEGLW